MAGWGISLVSKEHEQVGTGEETEEMERPWAPLRLPPGLLYKRERLSSYTFLKAILT